MPQEFYGRLTQDSHAAGTGRVTVVPMSSPPCTPSYARLRRKSREWGRVAAGHRNNKGVRDDAKRTPIEHKSATTVATSKTPQRTPKLTGSRDHGCGRMRTKRKPFGPQALNP